MTRRIRTIESALKPFGTTETVALYQAYGYRLNAYKPAAQSVTSSTALTNDDTLAVDLPTGPSLIDVYLPVTIGAAAGGLKLALVPSDGAAASISATATFTLDGTTSATAQITSSTAVNGGTTSAWTAVRVTGTINATQPGTLQLQWAQQASNASATQVLAGASMQLTTVTR